MLRCHLSGLMKRTSLLLHCFEHDRTVALVLWRRMLECKGILLQHACEHDQVVQLVLRHRMLTPRAYAKPAVPGPFAEGATGYCE